MAEDDFLPVIKPEKKEPETRELIKFLPEPLQTDFLKKIFAPTVDQWFSKKNIAEENGFIGRKDGLFFRPDKDFYLEEPTTDREATKVSRSID